MKKSISLLAILALLGCKEDLVKKPDLLIEKSKMMDIMYDLALLEAIKYQNPAVLDSNQIRPKQFIYKKYKIDSLQLAQNNKYYAADYKSYKVMFESVVKRIENEKKTSDESIKISQAEADAKLAIQNAVLDNVAGGIGILKQLGEKNKALQKAAIIAENAAGIARIIINTKAANAKAIAASPLTVGQPWVTINTISGALGVAGSLLATKKALSELGGGSASGGSVGTAPSGGAAAATTASATPAAAPQFNVVGTSGQNQIAQSLGNQPPVKAFVVSNDVTTAQSLDRNIVKTATIGG
jgi:hypothetical protein